MGNSQEHESNRHFQVKGWFPEYRSYLPANYHVKDELRLVAHLMNFDSLQEAYDEEAKIQYGWRKLGRSFPNTQKALISAIDGLSDEEAQFLKEAYRYSTDALDEEVWGKR